MSSSSLIITVTVPLVPRTVRLYNPLTSPVPDSRSGCLGPAACLLQLLVSSSRFCNAWCMVEPQHCLADLVAPKGSIRFKLGKGLGLQLWPAPVCRLQWHAGRTWRPHCATVKRTGSHTALMHPSWVPTVGSFSNTPQLMGPWPRRLKGVRTCHSLVESPHCSFSSHLVLKPVHGSC